MTTARLPCPCSRRPLAALVLTLAALTLAAPAARGQAQVFGTSCSGSFPAPSISFSGSVTPDDFGTVHLAGAPPLATVVCIVGLSDQDAFGIPLPFDLFAASVPGVQPGCQLWVSTDVVMLILSADAFGEIDFSFPNPSNIGPDLFFQWAVIESSSPASITLSEGLHLHMTAAPDAVPAALDFASVLQGTPSAPSTIELVNNTSLPMTITGLVVEGLDAAAFSALPQAALPLVLAPAASLGVDVTWTPTLPGPHSASLRVEQAGLPAGFAPTSVPLWGAAYGAPDFSSHIAAFVGQPTTADWGPDGRLYVGTRSGELHALTFDDDYVLLDQQIYDGVSLFNSNEILGLAFHPEDLASPVRVYVAHSELSAQGGGAFTGPSPYNGLVSVLEGPDFDAPMMVIMGLPVSNHDHGINGLLFDNAGDLFVCVGAITNAGVPTDSMGTLPESPLSGAVIKAETSSPTFNGVISYVETVSGLPNNDQVFGDIVDVAPGVDVAVYSAGFRNTYDLVLTTGGLLYATDNGPNSSFGNESADCASEGGPAADGDELVLLEDGHYYGHPNRNRGRSDPRQCVYHGRAEPSIPGVYTRGIADLNPSSNGLFEYRATTFGSQLYGGLVAQRWNSSTRWLQLAADGQSVVAAANLEPMLRSLDAVQGPGGALVGIDFLASSIRVRLPLDPSAVHPVAWDIFPWRAPAAGGTPFVIGGRSFADLGSTTVTIGGLPAVLTEVTGQRIRGTIPMQPSPTADLLDVVVVSRNVTSTIPDAFRYL